ncbi:glycoside hydrolase family 32 protein [Pontiella sulfatireligans]|uniref:Levanase n=1 Tax=Pontiella sulfatireligans TaxID=2750658 RepID=A0A6C2UQU9_9BACT|nr:glycoside hydrolase family 32 protein [Pontiella sulfatireligans]VGO22672.1 Levanase [Pontiella sulfatireligans]
MRCNDVLSCVLLTAGIAALFGAVESNAKPVPPEAQLKVTGTHLHVPVFSHKSAVENRKNSVHLGVFDGDRLVQDFQVTLPRKDQPYWVAAYPLDHFELGGKTVTIKLENDPRKKMKPSKINSNVWKWAMERISCGDNLPGGKAADYAKPYRNQFHASARRGWNNDPNGMVYHDGKYHLYFQHNPFGIYWGNMHWGHWESDDLIHWQEKPIALYQKTQRDMMFSGGGFVDFNNSSGLGEDTLFVAFTSTGRGVGGTRGECLAYSKDGGLTFTELPENPIISHMGRDPKIIWYEPEQKWVLTVYNLEECEETKALPMVGTFRDKFANFAYYESTDLRHWKRTGAFTDSDRAALHECPELFELKIENESRWITLGAQGRYFVGQFDGKKFIRESGPHGTMVGPYSSHGAFYAAQTFSDLPDGRRVQIGWVRTQQVYAGKFPGQLVGETLTLPHELQLRRTDEGLRMACVPVEEVKKLRAKEFQCLEECKGELTEVLIEFEEGGLHEMMINGIDASFEGKSARIFTDRTIAEVYANDGLFYQVRERSADSFDSTETVVKNGTIKSLKIYQLKSIWK